MNYLKLKFEYLLFSWNWLSLSYKTSITLANLSQISISESVLKSTCSQPQLSSSQNLGLETVLKIWVWTSQRQDLYYTGPWLVKTYTFKTSYRPKLWLLKGTTFNEAILIFVLFYLLKQHSFSFLHFLQSWTFFHHAFSNESKSSCSPKEPLSKNSSLDIFQMKILQMIE